MTICTARKTLVLIVATIIATATVFIWNSSTGVRVKDCGTNTTCWLAEAQSCSPARLVGHMDQRCFEPPFEKGRACSSENVPPEELLEKSKEILGWVGEKCAVSINLSGSRVKMDAYCLLPKKEIPNQAWQGFNITKYCSGSLADFAKNATR